ncbi:MAG: RNA polymerase sigma factor [Bacteroidota bacterium]|mgnify:CR=1 FL=1
MNVNRQLLRDCIRGDRRAEYQLYRSCFPVLIGVCMRYKNNRDDAVAVLNLGFLKILKGLAKYESTVPFEAWIRRIMINAIIDEFRRDRKVRELIEYKDFSTQPDPEHDQLDFNKADQQFDADQLEALIRQLPPVSQKVFNLFAIDGYSHMEIGEMLDISTGTSKWHLSFARKKLQEMMRELINTTKVI